MIAALTVLVAWPSTALATTVERADEEATTAAVELLEGTLTDRAITAAFVFDAGDERMVLFADTPDGEVPEPCNDADMPGDTCREPDPPPPPSAGLARIADGRLEMIFAPEPFRRFDWALEDTNGDGASELTVVVTSHRTFSRNYVDVWFWIAGPVEGRLRQRALVPLAGGRRNDCAAHGYFAKSHPRMTSSPEGPRLRIRYGRATATARCQNPESLEPLCECEERLRVVDLPFEADGTIPRTPPFHVHRGPFPTASR